MSDLRVDTLLSKVEHGNARFVAALLRRFTDEERRAAAKELPGLLRRVRDTRPDSPWTEGAVTSALLVAGAGCIPGPAAAAQWLARADLRLNRAWDFRAGRRHAEFVVTATEGRPAEWRAEVGRRLAGRLRVADQSAWGGDQAAWWTCALLLRAAGAGPPEDEAFTVGWVRWTAPATGLGEDPLLDAMVPRLFEVEAVGQVIGMFGAGNAWRTALTRLVQEGRLEREALLDGCVRRFLRGGALNDLRWYADLHDALAPDLDEVLPRIRDYARLLPAAPARVAELALREVRRVDEEVGLDEAVFAEAAEAVLFRPEKKLVRAALSWLDRPGREDAALGALTVAFGDGSHALQERAVRIAVKHGPKADEAVRERVREAATALPADLRDRVAEVFGEVEAPVPPPAGLAPPPPPAAFPAPIASVAELAEMFATADRRSLGRIGTERLLAGMVELAHADPGGFHKACRTTFREIDHWLWLDSLDDNLPGDLSPFLAAVTFLARRPHQRVARPRPRPSTRALARFLARRSREIGMLIGRTPFLLSTPTAANGLLDAGELVSRLERLEAVGGDAGVIDLAQALLRLPPGADPDAAARAARLTSSPGRTLAAWLENGGFPEVRFHTAVTPVSFQPDQKARTAVIAIATPEAVRLPDPAVVDELMPLLDFPGASWRHGSARAFSFNAYGGDPWWVPTIPSHAELAAAHLLPDLAVTLDHVYAQSRALLSLAEADGPVGVATATALAYGLTIRPVAERAGAVDALLLMAARGRLPAAELGAAVGALVGHGIAKLGRMAGALGEAADAGAHAEVWTVVEHALPPVLDAHAARPVTGLADLLALGARTAEATGARARIPALEALAARKGSSRAVKEAGRLHAYLTRP
ncbi:hypothetical protein Acsp03_21570 [Actinomadura sp. NBRC 104412]|uniref:DUF6493 family protein n=1 Tax=Actinomadura sp. NBRC 104412 TaxID=3032203 RepID=UPI0024A2BCC6|nr:DUF6493 family protein [Actinomadura sp. NBRC 104412]GLZ04691.1 hypothetical protein Acsp03_21570 [Actinomadura sp. NBRC 104412]